MGLSAPWSDSLDIIVLQLFKKTPWIKPIVLSVPMADYVDIIAFQKDKIN